MIHLANRLTSAALFGRTVRISNVGGLRRIWRISKTVGLSWILTADRKTVKSGNKSGEKLLALRKHNSKSCGPTDEIDRVVMLTAIASVFHSQPIIIFQNGKIERASPFSYLLEPARPFTKIRLQSLFSRPVNDFCFPDQIQGGGKRRQIGIDAAVGPGDMTVADNFSLALGNLISDLNLPAPND